MKGITVKIDLHQKYVDYIKSIYHDKKMNNGTIFASEKKDIGLLIKSLLAKPPKDYADIKEKITEPYIEFTLPAYTDFNTMYRYYLSENSKKIIRKFIRKRFYFDMHSHMKVLHNAGVDEIKACIIHFFELNSIEESKQNYESSKKEYYRYRSRIKQRKLTNISSVFLGLLSFLGTLIVLFAVQIF